MRSGECGMRNLRFKMPDLRFADFLLPLANRSGSCDNEGIPFKLLGQIHEPLYQTVSTPLAVG